eukprot:PhF_6_TR36473/c0_g1_i1/m.53532
MYQKLIIKGLRHKVSTLLCPDEVSLPKQTTMVPIAAFIACMETKPEVKMVLPCLPPSGRHINSNGHTHLIYFSHAIEAIEYCVNPQFCRVALHHGALNATFRILDGEYDLHGSDVNLVCRMLDVTQTGEVVISEAAINVLNLPSTHRTIRIIKWGPVALRTFTNFPMMYMAYYYPNGIPALPDTARDPPSETLSLTFPDIGCDVHWEKVLMYGEFGRAVVADGTRLIWPPEGNITFMTVMLCDVASFHQCFTPEDKIKTMNLFKKVLWGASQDNSGYVTRVSLSEERWEIVFANAWDAVRCVINIQLSMLGVNWPGALEANPKFQSIRTDTVMLFAGPRLRIGVHTFNATTRMDPFTLRVQYIAAEKEVSTCLAYACEAGESLISEDCLERMQTRLAQLDFPAFRQVATVTAPACPDRVYSCYSVVPRDLIERWKFFTRTVESDASVASISEADFRAMKQQVAVLEKTIEERTAIVTEIRNKLESMGPPYVNRQTFLLQGSITRTLRHDDIIPPSPDTYGHHYIVGIDVCSFEEIALSCPDSCFTKSNRIFNELILEELLTRYHGIVLRKVETLKERTIFLRFDVLSEALYFSACCQYELTLLNWPEDLDNIKACAYIKHNQIGGEDDRIIWRGFRVRMAIHLGIITHHYDSATGQKLPCGYDLNLVHRLLHLMEPGEIFLTQAVAFEMENQSVSVAGSLTMELGCLAVRGHPDPVAVFGMFPGSLVLRNPFLRKEVNLQSETTPDDPMYQDADRSLIMIHVQVSSWNEVKDLSNDLELYETMIMKLARQYEARVLHFDGKDARYAFYSDDTACQFISNLPGNMLTLNWSDDLTLTELGCEVRSEVGIIMRGLRFQVGVHRLDNIITFYDSVSDKHLFLDKEYTIPLALCISAHPGEALVSRNTFSNKTFVTNKMFTDQIGVYHFYEMGRPIDVLQVLPMLLQSRRNYFSELDLIQNEDSEKKGKVKAIDLSWEGRRAQQIQSKQIAMMQVEKTAAQHLEGYKKKEMGKCPLEQLVAYEFAQNAPGLVKSKMRYDAEASLKMAALEQFEMCRMFSEDEFYVERKFYTFHNIRSFLYNQRKSYDPSNPRTEIVDKVMRNLDCVTRPIDYYSVFHSLINQFAIGDRDTRQEDLVKSWVELTCAVNPSNLTQKLVADEVQRLVNVPVDVISELTKSIHSLRNLNDV